MAAGRTQEQEDNLKLELFEGPVPVIFTGIERYPTLNGETALDVQNWAGRVEWAILFVLCELLYTDFHSFLSDILFEQMFHSKQCSKD